MCIKNKQGTYLRRITTVCFYQDLIGGLSSFLFVFIAVQHLSVADATLLLNTAPFFIPFLVLFLFKERVKPLLWLGIIPGFVGIIFILNPSASLFQWYALLPLLSGVGIAVVFISLRRLHHHGQPLLRILFYLFFFSTV